MATFEEKILAYLDDSLPAEEREEVLHEAHSSRDARALLDAHVRLGSLYALTARPVSAPLDIQRELAAKVPILAVKLPYLATPEKRRKGIVAWFWESKLNVILLLLAALLGTGIWYMTSNPGSRITPAGTRSIPQGSTPGFANSHNGAQGNASSSATSNPNTTQAHSQPSGSPMQNIAPRNVAVPSIPAQEHSLNRSARIATGHSHTIARANMGRSNINRLNGNRSIATSAIDRSNRTKINGAEPSAAMAAENNITQNLSMASTTSQTSFVSDTFFLPPLRAISTSSAPIALRSAAIPIPVSMSESNNSYTPFRAFVEENIRSMSVPTQTQHTDFARQYGVWQNSVTSEGEEFGVDYELSPWVGIGVRGGNARFLQAEQIVHTIPVVGSYGRLSHSITETAILDPFAGWACVSGTYLINPAGRMEYELTLGGGDVFLGGFSPTALGEVAGTYHLSGTLALRVSISYQASWTTAASSIASNLSQSSVSGAAVLSTSPKLFASQALGFSIGVAVHP